MSAERLAVLDEMIAAAREAGDRHAELQAQNWRVTDLFELGNMTAWRAETARHARLADELRLPVFRWYTPLWAAVDAMLVGRYDDAERLSAQAEDEGLRAGDRNAELFPAMVRFCGQLEREAYDEVDIEFIEDKIANSPVGAAYRGSYAWILAGLGETERAPDELNATMALTHTFDANWLSLQAECAETSVLIEDATHAATLYERLAPYAGKPATAGRAVTSYGAIDRPLGGLAALLAVAPTPSGTSRMRSGSTTRSAARSGAPTPSSTWHASSARTRSRAEPGARRQPRVRQKRGHMAPPPGVRACL